MPPRQLQIFVHPSPQKIIIHVWRYKINWQYLQSQHECQEMEIILRLYYIRSHRAFQRPAAGCHCACVPLLSSSNDSVKLCMFHGYGCLKPQPPQKTGTWPNTYRNPPLLLKGHGDVRGLRLHYLTQPDLAMDLIDLMLRDAFYYHKDQLKSLLFDTCYGSR